MRETALTDDLVQKTPLSTRGKRTTLRDTIVKDLVLIVSNDKKTFCYLEQGLSSQLEQMEVIGTFPDVGADRARDVARKLRQRNRKKDDIMAGGPSAGPTFASVAHAYVKAITNRRLNKSVVADQKFVCRNLIDPNVNPFAAKPISQVTEHDVCDLVTVLKERGPQLAIAGLRKLKTIFHWAMRPDLRDRFRLTSNPTIHLSAGTFGLRTRFSSHILTVRELRVYLNAVDLLPDARERGLALAFALTGLRRSDLLNMRWSDLDLDRKIWKIWKRDRGFALPLSEAMADLLVRLRDSAGPDADAFVFTEGKPAINMTRLKRRLDAAMEIVGSAMNERPVQPWVFHDIRRTVHTVLSASSVDCNVASLALGRRLWMPRVYGGARHYVNAIRVALNYQANELAAIKDGSQPDWDRDWD